MISALSILSNRTGNWPNARSLYFGRQERLQSGQRERETVIGSVMASVGRLLIEGSLLSVLSNKDKNRDKCLYFTTVRNLLRLF